MIEETYIGDKFVDFLKCLPVTAYSKHDTLVQCWVIAGPALINLRLSQLLVFAGFIMQII